MLAGNRVPRATGFIVLNFLSIYSSSYKAKDGTLQYWRSFMIVAVAAVVFRWIFQELI